jgi:HAD superfamily hydrolase (TIGR01509 family)
MINTLFFDWDGTLVDSEVAARTAFRLAFRDLGVLFDEEIYEASYSPNWYATYEALNLPRDKWQTANDLWIRHYGEANPQLVDGASAAIATLIQKGYSLAIVTSGSESRVTREIQNLGFGSVFKAVICSEHVKNKKPHADGLEAAMNMLGTQRESAAYVGDAPEDIEMGKSAGVMTVGVRSSYPSSKRLHSAAPDLLPRLCRPPVALLLSPQQNSPWRGRF